MQIVQINNMQEAAAAMQAIGVTGRGIEIMSEKALFQAIRLERVDTRAANILKQTMLSQGGEAAVSAATVNLAAPYTDVLVLATAAQLRRAIPRLKEQPWGLKGIADELAMHLDSLTK
ncbi:dihydropteroate synthase [Anaerovibrio sp.]|uniref:dihydropteroate synthase n=1 Tax=Anaerovibrio sp. TaxID=1872532 RepID=UPI003F160038